MTASVNGVPKAVAVDVAAGRRWVHPPLTRHANVFTACQIGRAVALMRRLRFALDEIDEMALPAVLVDDFAAVDKAMRRVLLIAKHGCYPADVAREACDRVSQAMDADPVLTHCTVR